MPCITPPRPATTDGRPGPRRSRLQPGGRADPPHRHEVSASRRQGRRPTRRISTADFSTGRVRHSADIGVEIARDRSADLRGHRSLHQRPAAGERPLQPDAVRRVHPGATRRTGARRTRRPSRRRSTRSTREAERPVAGRSRPALGSRRRSTTRRVAANGVVTQFRPHRQAPSAAARGIVFKPVAQRQHLRRRTAPRSRRPSTARSA